MIAAYGLVVGLCLLVMAGLLPSLFGEVSYTLLMALSSLALFRFGKAAQGLRWQRGLYALSFAALLTAFANLAWVYGSVTGEMPLALELAGATLWTLECAPWAYALSLAIFIVYRRLRGAIFIELIAQLILLVSSVTFVVALVLGVILDFELGISVADNAKTYFSALLVLPAAALWFSRAELRLTRPFLLLSGATLAWFLADLFYVRLPESYNIDMIYNALASVQWLLVYLAGRQYLKSSLTESARLTEMLPLDAIGKNAPSQQA